MLTRPSSSSRSSLLTNVFSRAASSLVVSVVPSSSSVTTEAISAMMISSSPILLESARTPATRSGPKAFLTDRQRRRTVREQTSLDKIIANAEKRKKAVMLANKKKIEEGEDTSEGAAAAATASQQQSQDTNNNEQAEMQEEMATPAGPSSIADAPSHGKRGRAKAIEVTLREMRGKFGDSKELARQAGLQIESSLERVKAAKRRQPLRELVKQQQQQQQQTTIVEQGGGGDRDDDHHPAARSAAADEKAWPKPTKTRNTTETSSSRQQSSSAKKDEHDDLCPKQASEAPDGVVVDDDHDDKPTSTSSLQKHQHDRSAVATNDVGNHHNTERALVQTAPQTCDEFALFAPPVVSDVGASKLDEIELACSGALAKRVKSQLPLPVFATDDETVENFFPDTSSSFADMTTSNDDADDLIVTAKAEAALAIKRARGKKLEELSRKFIERHDGPAVAEAEMFRRNAQAGKEALEGTEMAEYVALEYKGDEAKELDALAEQVKKLESAAAAAAAAAAEKSGGHQQDEKQQVEGKGKRDNTSGSGYNLRSHAKSQTLDDDITTRTRLPSSEITSRSVNPATHFHTQLSTMAKVLDRKRLTRADDLDPESPSQLVHRRADIAETQQELLSDEQQTMSPLDASVDFTFDARVRKGLLKYYARYPINNMIRFPTIIIGGIQDDKGVVHKFANSERPAVTLAQARKIAAEHGKDLIQVAVLQPELHPALVRAGRGDKRGASCICYIADHLGYAMDDIEFMTHLNEPRVSPSQLRPLLDVGFRGVSHDFAIRFKSVHIAKFLYKRFPVRIILTKFGTVREGFPIFERVLGFIRAECDRMNAFFVAGQVRYDSGSIYCYLHPSTVKMPLTSTDVPTSDQLAETYERATFDAEYDREVAIPESFSRNQQRELNRYHRSLDEGTAWAHRSEGLSLQQQRKLKIMQGFIPKGNKELYSKRGDVELNSPFGSHSPTGTERISFPRESNLEQAERAAGVLHRRLEMDVSDVLDKGELPHETHELGKFEFMMVGDVMSAGEMKEAMGLKNNRKRVPRYATGHATVGQAEDDGVSGRDIMKF